MGPVDPDHGLHWLQWQTQLSLAGYGLLCFLFKGTGVPKDYVTTSYLSNLLIRGKKAFYGNL